MKKIALWLVLIQGLVLAGCGSTAPTKASVSGYIINQDGAGIPEVKISIGSNEIATNSTGWFSMNSLKPGSYVISGSGGSTGHYLVESTTVKLKAGSNNMGNIMAYRILGCGVIIQSTSKSFPVKTNSIHQTFKRITQAELNRPLDKYISQSGNFNSKSVSPEFLSGNISFILINWEKIKSVWIDHYKIYYLGPYGSQNILVWNSGDSHSGDPPFDSEAPQAYLDLSDELTGMITTAGSYRFRIMALSATESQSQQLPDATVSLGMNLETYPNNLVFSDPNLTWTGVVRASGYKVAICTDSELSNCIWNTANMLPSNSISITAPSSLTKGVYYYWYVNAYYNDQTSWPTEITRGISGFTR